MSNSPEVKVMVSGVASVKILPAKVMVSAPGLALALRMACRNDPSPLSLVLVTTVSLASMVTVAVLATLSTV
ncbi:hypothetical protein H6H01_06380 [Nostoc calcicola FACHB-3891]|nr:hypothetical protein [Nostoc calcicola FACHB-3891]